jgi:carbonic anhydrase/acetyltransferase-like protein (isoleucine patch superfamily)
MMIYAIGERHFESEGDDYYVAPSAQLIGSVRLRAGASVWFNAVLRADDEWIEIGPGSNVQDGSVIHIEPGQPAILGRDVTIGHMVMLHSCHIGDETLIGNNAIVLDRARIGRHCLIAAGALVPPDKVIPDGSVVMGVPGRIMRTATAADLQLIRYSAANYQQRARRYRQELRLERSDP